MKFSKPRFHGRGFRSDRFWAGIEVGQVAVKFVVLSSRRGRLAIEHFAYLEIPDPSSPNRGEALRDALQEIQHGCPIRDYKVAAVAGGRDVSVHMVKLPRNTPRSRFGQAAIFQAMSQAPEEKRDLVWNAVRRGVDDRDRLLVMVASAPRVVIRELSGILGESGLEPDLVTVPSLTLRLLAPEDPATGNTAVVDIGCRTTTVAVFRERSLVYTRDTRVGSELITQELAQRLGGDVALAEMVKRHWVLPRKGEPVEPVCLGSESYTIDPSELDSVKLLVEELVRSLRYVEDRAGIPIRQVVLTGGGSQLKGLGEYLDLPQPVTVATADHAMFPEVASSSVNRPLLEAMAPSLTRAVCAAHLGLTRPLVARLNLLDDLQPKVKSVGTKSSRLAWIRAVAYAGIFVVLAQMLVRAAEGNLERRRDGFSVFEDTGEGNAVETVLPPADPAPWAHGLSAIGALLPVEIGLDQVETLNLETRVSRDRGYDPELAALLDPGPGPQSSSSLALRLEGSAKTRRVLGDLLVALREAPEVSDAYLEWTLRPQEGGKPYMRFSMVATLAEPSKPGESVP